MGTSNEARFEFGTRVYYDGNPGRVVGMTYDTNPDWTLGNLTSVQVRWDNGNESKSSPADLMTEAEYHEFCEEFE